MSDATVPYLGSKISLVSKGDVRYVGTLVKVDAEESKLVLHGVKSFGTEGRKSGNDIIAASKLKL